MTLEEILQAAVDKPAPAERAAYLESTCGQDPALRGQVESLLKAYQEAGNFLEEPLFERSRSTEEMRVAEVPGTVIGPYRLLEEIGEGGFGVVFMAEQTEPVRRKVALKVLKAGMDTRQVVGRFEAERQALSIMDHPNIAKVFDGGVTLSGRPYFVMELVKGAPITTFCDRNHLTPRQRLELFVAVCHAVQHAHQKGVIHRDLKPSNVMVALHDTTPAPKVIDFGVAKAVGHELTDRTLFTGFAQLIGTPLYMSPEQAGQSSLDIDTRSDIYSLGVLLYELLTGTTPFDVARLRSAGYDEMRRIVCHEEPARPSQRLSTLGASLTAVSEQRQTDPKRLRQLLRGDLDWIVMKALEKDRTRRYETANSFAADVQRYLNDEPVQACPPSAGYRLRKFVRRNKGTVVAASLVALALLAGMAGTTWGMIRAEQAHQHALSAQLAEAERAEGERRAKEEAQKRLEQVEKGTELLAAMFRDLDPMAVEKEGVPPRVLLGRWLGQASRLLEGEAVGDPLVVARLQHMLGISLRELGDLRQAEALLVKACQTRERLLESGHLDTAAAKHDLAMLYREQRKYAQAEALYNDVLAVRVAKLGHDHADTLTTQHHLAILYHSQAKLRMSEALFKQVIAIRTAKLGADHPDTLTSQNRLAEVYRAQARYDVAEALHKEVLEHRTRTLGPGHLDTVATKHNLATLYRGQEKYALAEPLYNDVLAVRTAKLGADHPDTLTTRHHLGALYHGLRKDGLAETMLKGVLAARTEKLGASDAATLGTQISLAELYEERGDFALGETLRHKALATCTAMLGPDHLNTLDSHVGLAMFYWAQKKLDQAISHLQLALTGRKAAIPDHPDTLGTQAELGRLYCDAGRFLDAIPLLEEVRQKDRENTDLLKQTGQPLLIAYARTGKATKATVLALEQAEAARKEFSADRSKLAAALASAGRWLVEAKSYAAAEPLLRESLSLGEAQVPVSWTTHHARSLLGHALLRQQKYADAEPHLVQGYLGMKVRVAEIPAEERGYLRTARERVFELYTAWGKPDEAAKWREQLAANTKTAEKVVPQK